MRARATNVGRLATGSVVRLMLRSADHSAVRSVPRPVARPTATSAAIKGLRAGLSAAMLLGCACQATAAPLKSGEPLKVVVTIKPVHALVAGVLAGIAEPLLLVDGQASPHTFTLKPSAARAAHDAHVLVRVSPAVEPFSERLARSVSSAVKVVTLAEAPGLVLLARRSGDAFEAHAHAAAAGDAADRHEHDSGTVGGPAGAAGAGHDTAHHADPDAGHDARQETRRDTGHGAGPETGDDPGHDPGGGSHHDAGDHTGHDSDHDAAQRDGHIWLDPDNARRIVAHLVDVFTQLDPAHAARFAANGAALSKRIAALSADIDAATRPLRGKPFVVFHDATQYFERRFGLQAAGAVTVSPDVQPSAQRLTALRRRIAALGAVCVYAEPQFQGGVIASVVEGTRSRSAIIDPEGALLAPGPELYFQLLGNLAAAMVRCQTAP